MDRWAQRWKERVGRIGRVALIYIHHRVKQIANGNLLYSTGSLAWCSVTTWKGGMWGWCEGGPRGVDICMSVTHSVVFNSL